MMEVVNTLSLKNKHVVISFCIAEISAKENRCHSDMCFPVMRVSRTHIPRDACFPAHISLTRSCTTSHSDICFPRDACFPANACMDKSNYMCVL